ncbi:hypothetical protein BJX68DRAFT_176674 [Aspergillus pseudodeflectus]|uniref:Uncharacterized protein n=1 Tax=Aspergillus pseudodeflectus TaxID=176178 RepID=A0ABR4L1P2_9EURO
MWDGNVTSVCRSSPDRRRRGWAPELCRVPSWRSTVLSSGSKVWLRLRIHQLNVTHYILERQLAGRRKKGRMQSNPSLSYHTQSAMPLIWVRKSLFIFFHSFFPRFHVPSLRRPSIRFSPENERKQEKSIFCPWPEKLRGQSQGIPDVNQPHRARPGMRKQAKWST